MNITGIGQNLSHRNTITGNSLPAQPESHGVKADVDTGVERAKKIDMRNISFNEVSELVKSGIDGGLLDRIPIKSILDENGNLSQGIGGYLPDEKIDFIGSLEKVIAYKKSIGQSVLSEEKTLEKYHQIDGMAYPAKLDIFA